MLDNSDMKNFVLSSADCDNLRNEHRKTKNKRYAYRINAIILLGTGWTQQQVSDALLVDIETLRNWVKQYKLGGVKSLLLNQYKGGQARLSSNQLTELQSHLDENLYMQVSEIIFHVKKVYDVSYSVSGMTDLLHRLGFVYKKPQVVPCKANADAQVDFVEKYTTLKKDKGSNDPIYFMDGVHPQHNSVPAYGWIKRGHKKELKTNTGRKRVNINGALNLDGLDVVMRTDDSINAQSTIALLNQIESKHDEKTEVIYIICDNARYYRSKLVKEYLEKSRIELVFLPPYSPNLNLIERLWKFFKKKVLYNTYIETFTEFKIRCDDFFGSLSKYKSELKTLITEKFQIIGTLTPKT